MDGLKYMNKSYLYHLVILIGMLLPKIVSNGKCSISLRILKHLPVNLHEMKIVAQIFNNLLTRNGCYTLLWAGV